MNWNEIEIESGSEIEIEIKIEIEREIETEIEGNWEGIDKFKNNLKQNCLALKLVRKLKYACMYANGIEKEIDYNFTQRSLKCTLESQRWNKKLQINWMAESKRLGNW